MPRARDQAHTHSLRFFRCLCVSVSVCVCLCVSLCVCVCTHLHSLRTTRTKGYNATKKNEEPTYYYNKSSNVFMHFRLIGRQKKSLKISIEFLIIQWNNLSFFFEQVIRNSNLVTNPYFNFQTTFFQLIFQKFQNRQIDYQQPPYENHQ